MKKKYSIDNYTPVSCLEDPTIHLKKIRSMLSGREETMDFLDLLWDKQSILVEERDIIDKAKTNSNEFITQYCKLKKIKYSSFTLSERKVFNVKRSRINTKLIDVGYRINTDFVIEKYDEIPSLQRLIIRLKSLLEGKKYDKIRLFDYYKKDELGEQQKVHYIDIMSSFIDNGAEIEIVTGLNNSGSSAIYMGMLLAIGENEKIRIKYLPKKTHMFSSITYVLMENSNKSVIAYFEPGTRWLVAEEIDKKDSKAAKKKEFLYTFWELLSQRFENHFNSDRGIFLDTFDLKNEQQITSDIIDDMLLFFNIDKDIKYDTIKKNILKLYAIDSSKVWNTKILSSLLTFINALKEHRNNKNNAKDISTIITKIINSGLLTDIRKSIIHLSDTGSVFTEDLLDNNFIISVHTKKYFINNSSLAELFSDCLWNNIETAHMSLSKILENPDLLVDFLTACNEFSEISIKTFINLKYTSLIQLFFLILYKYYNVNIPDIIEQMIKGNMIDSKLNSLFKLINDSSELPHVKNEPS